MGKQEKKHARIRASSITKIFLKHARDANHLKWKRTVSLEIKYGEPEILATGIIFKRFAKELAAQGYLKINKNGVYELNIDKPEGGNLTKEEVEAKIKEIETYCVEKEHIKGLREERLPLCDDHDEKRLNEYATYNRNLDVLGLMVHSVATITYVEDGKHADDIIVAKRHEYSVIHKNDSIYDLLSGAIGVIKDVAKTALQTIRDEGNEEFGLSPEQASRAKKIGYVTTHRRRDNTYSIVREKMQVWLLPLKEEELKIVDGKITGLQCIETKTVTETGSEGDESKITYHPNEEFVLLPPEKLIDVLGRVTKVNNRKVNYLENGKAEAAIAFLVNKIKVFSNDALAKRINLALSRPSRRWYGGGWVKRVHSRPVMKVRQNTRVGNFTPV